MRVGMRSLGVIGASLLLLGAVACGGGGDDDDSDAGSGLNTSSESAPRAAATAADAQGAGALYGSDGEAAGGAVTGTSLNQDFARKIIFSTALTVSVPDVESSFIEVQRLARASAGYVESSSLSIRETDNGEPQFANITIRVPVSGYDNLLDSLRTLEGAKVTREESQSTEVTEEYTDLTSRLRNLEQNEAQYLKLLEQAATIDDILKVNERLDGIRGQIEQIQGRINVLDNLTELATIDVRLAPIAPARVSNSDSGGIPTVSEAFEGALDFSVGALRLLAAAGAVAAVAAIWLVPVAVIAVVARRFTRRPAA